MTKATLFGASNPTAYDGSMILPGGDAILPGTIWSYQPGHAAYGTGGVAPTNGATAKNAAWREAALAMGLTSADESTLHGAWTFGSDTASSRLVVETTPLGGVHGIVSQTLGTANTHAFVSVPDAIKTYILNNTVVGGSSATDTGQPWNTSANHRFGHVVWLKETRVPRSDSGKVGANVAFLSIPNMVTMTQAAVTPNWPVSGVENTGFSTTTTTAIGATAYPALPMVLDTPQTRWAASRGWNATEPANAAAMQAICGFGPMPGQTASGFLQSAMSYVLYRWDIIDLSLAMPYGNARAFRGIAGTDFSHTLGDIFGVRNALHGAFSRAFAPGGQFYGDTITTAPASVP